MFRFCYKSILLLEVAALGRLFLPEEDIDRPNSVLVSQKNSLELSLGHSYTF